MRHDGAIAGLAHIFGAAAATLRPDRTWLDPDRLDFRDAALIANVLPAVRAFTRRY